MSHTHSHSLDLDENVSSSGQPDEDELDLQALFQVSQYAIAKSCRKKILECIVSCAVHRLLFGGLVLV